MMSTEDNTATVLILFFILVLLVLLLFYLYKRLNRETKNQYTIEQLVFSKGGLRDQVMQGITAVEARLANVRSRIHDEEQALSNNEEDGEDKDIADEEEEEEEEEEEVEDAGQIFVNENQTNEKAHHNVSSNDCSSTDQTESVKQDNSKEVEKEEEVEEEKVAEDEANGHASKQDDDVKNEERVGLLVDLKTFSGSAIWCVSVCEMLLASAVVVWEWLNEHGRWRPYSPAVSHHIEAVIRGESRGAGCVALGQVDSRLSPYIIDLHSMHQFRQDTGTLRPVRRSFYDPRSAPGQGWVWEWENDSGTWTPYDTEVGIAIQAARERQQPWLDLTPLGFCYLIDLQGMTQINRQTQRRRRIQRRCDLAYPLVSGPLPKPHAWTSNGSAAHSGMSVSGIGGGNGSAYPSGALPASTITSLGQPCSCQQCMLVLGVKTSSIAQTLGRKPMPLPRPRSPKTAQRNHLYSLTLPHRNSTTAGGFADSLSMLDSATASLSISSSRPPPPAVPPPPPPSSTPHATSPPSQTSSSALISTTATCAPTPSARVLGPVSSAACAAPVPPRASLAGLSRPALQRIAMAQSRALIASGVPTVPVKNLNGSSPVHPALAGRTPEEVVRRYLQKVRNPPEEDCTICMEALAGPSGYKGPGVGGISRAESVGRLSQCGHQYHLQCLVAMYNNGNKDGSLQCPTCKTIYGGPEHPNPGKPFTARGFPRHCYLPDSEKGRLVLKLLLVAWDRRLIFSVGTSSTTGETDTVIWNEVHHKTEFGSNLTGHGYPDSGHLDNVLEELRAQGITEEDCLRD
ncbi:E3 ubiquitin-protein ligase DTX4 [Bagarius yarrelli]|uniref:E3 ubiquitin-protein ligase n=1 Tax=Bagarius yarrelli TaxID=175774 RepID=A0A556TVE3_BAGYA|nr:E3 ubiquitin-protein ligase DTX4 [Bagarius yarrelli]